MRLIGNNIYLGCLDITEAIIALVDWLEDEEIVKYGGWVRTMPQSKEVVREYLEELINNESCRLFGIYTRDYKYIGNIRLDIEWIWRVGICSILIGDKTQWGKGYGTEAIELITDFGFNTLGLHRIEAGVLDGNISSRKAFLKAGFTEEGRRKERRFVDGKYTDEIILGKIASCCCDGSAS